jgi:hypothetical protein
MKRPAARRGKQAAERILIFLQQRERVGAAK